MKFAVGRHGTNPLIYRPKVPATLGKNKTTP